MELLVEAQVVHVLEIRHIGPLAASSVEPLLPGRRLDVRWRPVAVYERMLLQVGGMPAPCRSKYLGIADWPKRIAEQLLCHAMEWHKARVPYGHIGFASLQAQDVVCPDHFE